MVFLLCCFLLSIDAPTPGEPCSKEAKQFVEIRLLNRSILVYLDGLDKFNVYDESLPRFLELLWSY